jgi:hypothetical protein
MSQSNCLLDASFHRHDGIGTQASLLNGSNGTTKEGLLDGIS